MDTAVKPRAAKKPAAKERQDLRAWIAQLRAVGELQDINGPEREREIGGQCAGRAKQAGLIASQCHAGAYGNRFVVVVDDDIDPSDMDKVVWAMCTRFDPREGMETLRGCWSTALDPMAYGADDPRNAPVVIDACKPFKRRDTFPVVVRASKEVEDLVRNKFPDVLPR